jgi:P-type Cu+ transporter
VSCGEEASAIYKVIVIGSGTYLGRLEHMVTKIKETRPITLNIVDSITQWFIPFVILFSVLTGLVWSTIFSFNLIKLPETSKISPFLFVFQSMVAVLVVACPCALGKNKSAFICHKIH